MSGHPTMVAAATVHLRVDGVPVPDGIAARVLTVEVVEVDRRPAQATVAIQSREPIDTVLPTGHELEVRVGPDGASLFRGTITTIERTLGRDRAGTVVVTAHDALHALRGARVSAAHQDVGVSDVVQAIANEHGLQLEVHGATAERTLGHVVQHAESGLALLHRLAVRAGALLTARGDVLHWAVPAELGPPVQLDLDVDVHELRTVRHDVTEQTEVGSFDRHSARSHRSGTGSASGGWWLEDDEADGLAAGLAAEAAARATHLELTIDGNPQVRPGTPLRVGGVPGGALSGVVRSATHWFGPRSGYVTTISTEPPDAPPVAPPAALSLGTVVDVTDPESRGRVTVTLDAFGDVRSAWLPTVMPSAGRERGLLLLPRVGDRVVVAGPHGDLGRGVVLGSLWGDEPLPFDPVVGGDTARFGIGFADGMQVVLDIDARTLRLDDGAGSTFELGPDRVTLTSAVPLDIEAPGQRMTLRADTIAMERG